MTDTFEGITSAKNSQTHPDPRARAVPARLQFVAQPCSLSGRTRDGLCVADMVSYISNTP